MKEFMTYLPLILMFTYLFSSALVILYAWRKDKPQLHIDFRAVATFMGFMSLVTMIRLCMFDSGVHNVETFGLKMGGFLWVWLEDAFFVMIPYYLSQKINNKYLKIMIWAAFSLVFASGHLYQGPVIAAITALYPYYISRKYAMKTSFATVMVCHFLYDTVTFSTLKIAKLRLH